MTATGPGERARTATLVDPGRRLAVAVSATLACGLAYTAGTVWLPGLRIALAAPDLRVVIEVSGLLFVLFAALVLSLPGEIDVRPARDAFVAALVVLALANAVFAVGPFVAADRLTVDRGLAFYPWISARYISGLLFIAAGLERPRLGLARMLWASLALLAAVELALVGLSDRLPVAVLIDLSAGAQAVQVVAPVGHAIVQAVPGLLFGLGSVLAGRLYRTSQAPLYLWLSLSLAVQVVTQVHEILYPAILGPIITSADLLRILAFTLLLTGAILQLRRLYRSRSRAVRAQQADLDRQAVLVDELHSFAETEADFRGIVSHELATPIAAIRAFAHVLSVSARSDDPPRVRRAVAGIEAEARRLTELVGRMDELRDLELSGFSCELRPVRIQPIMTDAMRFVEGLPGRHPVALRSSDVRIEADPVRLGQLLRNVLANAARYSEPGTPIEIEGAPDGGSFRLCVIDHGPGIPPHERERVLRRYARGGPDGGSEGSGIGLYVAARIAQAHGGELRLDSPPGAGTVVTIRLRLAA